MVDISEIDTLTDALRRIQDFDTESLIQAERLGEFNFSDLVKPTQKIIDLFSKIPVDAARLFPASQQKTIKNSADALFQQINEARQFSLKDGSGDERHAAIIRSMENSYQTHFDALYPLISYSMSQTVDFNNLETQGRAAVQQARDMADSAVADLEAKQKDVENILATVREAAAEQGVSQQAIYFKTEAEDHSKAADFWRWWTIAVASLLGAYGVLTLFLHKIPYFAPQNVYETIQLTVAKVLIFFVLGYMLSLCARNFLSNRHNEIVNRHRQNALLTYKALADASPSAEMREVILNHAAAAIYRLHDTGYVKAAEGSGSSSSSVVEMIPRTTMSMSSPSNS